MGLISSNLAGEGAISEALERPQRASLGSQGVFPAVQAFPAGCVSLFPGGASSWVGEAGHPMVFPEPQVQCRGARLGAVWGPEFLGTVCLSVPEMRWEGQ